MQKDHTVTSTQAEEAYYFRTDDLNKIISKSYPQPYRRMPLSLEILGATPDNSGFNFHGHDTLTIGDQKRWINAKIVRKIVDNPYAPLDQNISHLVDTSKLPRVHYRNAKQVRSFLAKHIAENIDVAQYIETVWPTLIKHFGADIELYLEVLDYPEAMAEPELVAWIQCADSVDEGLRKLDAFEDDLIESNVHNISLRFSFNIEFK